MVEQQLTDWLEEGYVASFRTACLILGNRADAEEAVQQAFLRVWRFRASLGAIADHAPWLYRVVVSACCSKLRHDGPWRDRPADLPDDAAKTAASPDERLWQSEVSRAVLSALGDLPVHVRVAVVLRYYDDLSERQVAAAIGRRPGTVKSRLHEARRQLATRGALRDLAGSGVSTEVLS